MSMHVIGLEGFSLKGCCDILNLGVGISISKEAREKVIASHSYLKQRLADRDEAIYGVNTGFGSLCDTVISKDRIEELIDVNLIVPMTLGHFAEIGKLSTIQIHAGAH